MLWDEFGDNFEEKSSWSKLRVWSSMWHMEPITTIFRVLEVVVQIDFSSIGVLSVAGEEQRSQSQSLLLT